MNNKDTKAQRIVLFPALFLCYFVVKFFAFIREIRVKMPWQANQSHADQKPNEADQKYETNH
jgi:hypothetical protein